MADGERNLDHMVPGLFLSTPMPALIQLVHPMVQALVDPMTQLHHPMVQALYNTMLQQAGLYLLQQALLGEWLLVSLALPFA